MRHFVVVYDRSRAITLEVSEHDDRSVAYNALTERESEYRYQQNIEVVLLISDSEATLRRTHGRYFRSLSGLLAR